LMTVGVSERDADDIALAVSDLGLGYVPVRDFSNSTTIESAVYAMRKSCEAAGDAELGANALACIARIARVDSSRPKGLSEAGCVEPIVKILQRNLGDANCVVQAYAALQALAIDDEIATHLGNVAACDVVPRALQSHVNNQVVVEEGCKLIAMLSRLPENNLKLGTAGACDVVMKGLLKHINHKGVAQHGCDAANKLAFGNFENVGKLGYHNACQALSGAITTHYEVAAVAEQALRAMNILAVEPENRARMGKLGGLQGTVLAMDHHLNDPVITEFGLRLISTMIVGNANNRTLLGQLGAPLSVMRVLEAYSSLRSPSKYLKPLIPQRQTSSVLMGGMPMGTSQNTEPPLVFDFPVIIQFACTATYSLAAGSPQNMSVLAKSYQLLVAIAQSATEYTDLAHAHQVLRKPVSIGNMRNQQATLADTANSNTPFETVCMQKIKSEANEAVQRVSKS
jgi:hypothetical protein